MGPIKYWLTDWLIGLQSPQSAQCTLFSRNFPIILGTKTDDVHKSCNLLNIACVESTAAWMSSSSALDVSNNTGIHRRIACLRSISIATPTDRRLSQRQRRSTMHCVRRVAAPPSRWDAIVSLTPHPHFRRRRRLITAAFLNSRLDQSSPRRDDLDGINRRRSTQRYRFVYLARWI